MSEVKKVLVGVMHTMAYEGKPNVDEIKKDAKLDKVTAADRDAAWEQYQEELQKQARQNAGTDGKDGDGNTGQEGDKQTGAANDSSDESGTDDGKGSAEQQPGGDAGDDKTTVQDGDTVTGVTNDGDSSDGSGTSSDADTQETPPTPDKNNTDTGEAEAVLVVKTKRAKGSRRRGGFRFGGEPVAIPLVDLTDEQVDEIKADPALSVKEELV